MSTPISVCIVENHRLLAEALEDWIRNDPGLRLHSAVSDGDGAIASLKASPADVALVDQSLLRVSGLEVVRRLVQDNLPTRFLMLTSFGSPLLVAEALDAGVHGFLLKEDSKAEILAGIRQVHEGTVVLSARLDRQAIREAMASRRITDREREVLELLAAGLTAVEIGARLHIGQRTVETHRNSLICKFGAKNAVELARRAAEAGLLPP